MTHLSPYDRAAIAVSSEATIAVDLERRIVDVNPACETLLGYPRGALLGQSTRVIYPEDKAFETQGLTHVHPGIPLEGIDYDLRLRHRDGTILPTRVTTAPVHGDNGLIGFVSVVRNRKEAVRRTVFLQNVIETCAEATLNLEQKIAALLDLGRAYFELDIGIVSAVTRERYTVEHVAGGDGAIKPGDVFALPDTYCEMVVAAAGPRAFHHVGRSEAARHPCYAGTALEAYIGTPILVSGKRVGTLNFSSMEPRARAFDTDELSLVMTLAAWIGNELGIRRQALALQHEHERYRRLYRRTPGLLHTLDDAFRFTHVSDHWLATFGYEAREVLGQSAFDFIHESSLAEAHAVVPEYESRARLERMPITFKGRAPDGGERLFEVELSAVKDDSSTYVVLDDVTARNAATRALEEANAELSRLNDSLREFAYVASHDLQEPLRKITQFASFLVEDHRDALPEEGRYFVDTLASSAQRMSRLIHDLLAYSRAANVALDIQPIDLAEAVRRVVDEFDVTIDSTGARIEVGALPTVRADAVQLDQLLRNLVGNALKYRHPDRAPVITVTAREEGETTTVTVADNGIGFDPAFTTTIFEPFKRLHNRTDYEGSGIGLALCRAICDRLGWRITAQGRKGDGRDEEADDGRNHGMGAAFHLKMPRDGGPRHE